MTFTSAAPRGRLPLPRLLAFATGSMPVWILVTLMGVYIPRFYAGHIGISLIAVGGAIVFVRLTDLVIDLTIGWMMDKTSTRFGRYRPWYALGLPVLWIGAYKIFNPPTGAGVGYLVGWMIVNTLTARRFDPFPFSLLTSIVSLEAIFLTLFVLASQNRLTQESDKRAHLDLQVNLLAEQEMTLVLRMLRDLCVQSNVDVPEALGALLEDVDIERVAERVEEELPAEKVSETGAASPRARQAP